MMSTFVVTTVLLIVAMGLLRVEMTESIPVRQAPVFRKPKTKMHNGQRMPIPNARY
jgi:hypothetical protein